MSPLILFSFLFLLISLSPSPFSPININAHAAAPHGTATKLRPKSAAPPSPSPSRVSSQSFAAPSDTVTALHTLQYSVDETVNGKRTQLNYTVHTETPYYHIESSLTNVIGLHTCHDIMVSVRMKKGNSFTISHDAKGTNHSNVPSPHTLNHKFSLPSVILPGEFIIFEFDHLNIDTESKSDCHKYLLTSSPLVLSHQHSAMNHTAFFSKGTQNATTYYLVRKVIYPLILNYDDPDAKPYIANAMHSQHDSEEDMDSSVDVNPKSNPTTRLSGSILNHDDSHFVNIWSIPATWKDVYHVGKVRFLVDDIANLHLKALLNPANIKKEIKGEIKSEMDQYGTLHVSHNHTAASMVDPELFGSNKITSDFDIFKGYAEVKGQHLSPLITWNFNPDTLQYDNSDFTFADLGDRGAVHCIECYVGFTFGLSVDMEWNRTHHFHFVVRPFITGPIHMNVEYDVISTMAIQFVKSIFGAISLLDIPLFMLGPIPLMLDVTMQSSTFIRGEWLDASGAIAKQPIMGSYSVGHYVGYNGKYVSSPPRSLFNVSTATFNTSTLSVHGATVKLGISTDFSFNFGNIATCDVTILPAAFWQTQIQDLQAYQQVTAISKTASPTVQSNSLVVPPPVISKASPQYPFSQDCQSHVSLSRLQHGDVALCSSLSFVLDTSLEVHLLTIPILNKLFGLGYLIDKLFTFPEVFLHRGADKLSYLNKTRMDIQSKSDWAFLVKDSKAVTKAVTKAIQHDCQMMGLQSATDKQTQRLLCQTDPKGAGSKKLLAKQSDNNRNNNNFASAPVAVVPNRAASPSASKSSPSPKTSSKIPMISKAYPKVKTNAKSTSKVNRKASIDDTS